MSQEIAFVTADKRRAVAYQTVADFGAGYLNSLVGDSAAETCEKIEAIMPFIQQTMDRRSSDELEDMRPVLSFLMQSIWTAVQYESGVGDESQ